MKKSLMMGVALAGLLAGSAVAADLPVKARSYTAAAPAFSWTGCYIGAQVGGGAMNDSWTGEHGNGALAGGQVGCNYQTGMLVFGIEGDGFWSGMNSNYSDAGIGFEGSTYSESWNAKNKYDFSVAGRFGVAFDRTLIYGKAGWVWGKFDFDAACSGNGCNNIYSEAASDTLNGILMGVGLEYALDNHWTTKIEYNYLNYGSKNLVVNGVNSTGTPYTYSYTHSFSADKNIIKVGLNYKFF